MVSCANLQAGWFSAYRHLADRDDLDAVLHLGDYIYEYGPGEYGYGQDDVDVRPHEPAHEILTLADYRQRHAQYKRDPDLQRLHAKYAVHRHLGRPRVGRRRLEGRRGEPHRGRRGRLDRAAGRRHQAYDEWMPVRMSGTAALGDGDTLYRRLQFGELAELTMLDLRSYRDKQLAAQVDPAQADPDRTITGRAQMDWLKGSLVRRTAQWKLVGNPVMIAPVTFAGVPRDLVEPVNDTVGLLPPDGVPYNVDQWDGYTDDRRELFEHLRDNGVTDTVFLTGDIHSGWACDLPADKATYPAPATRSASSSSRTSVTSNNLKDITGTPAAHDERRGRGGPQGQQPAHQVHRLRRPRLLGPRHHREASADGLVHHRRPRRQGDRHHLDASRGRPRRAARWSTRSTVALTRRRSADVQEERTATFDATVADRRTVLKVAGASGRHAAVLDRAGDARCPRRRCASAPTCWSSTAAAPARSTTCPT